MNGHEQDRMKQILKHAMPPVEADAEPDRDLWPALLRQIDGATSPGPTSQDHNWFDWALFAGLVIFVASFPATIPVFLYYL